ncbi:hypothetical protein SAMD00020551_2387 [Mesobacillus selenatarsenatis SF-1]|uniref:Uncharacterized protein n=1 Tax=Mesobacillus selenatarsenatis (strain DSM 18680 / JCM 14380 / FERM P-15431 / SF-1) TaxID=1321606 RepID=A0A0A8X4N7_MESS1|nr:hypothetical protein SAMD00020551_2387 [Mesobacillus selenatarsenatis SF-1]
MKGKQMYELLQWILIFMKLSYFLMPLYKANKKAAQKAA